MPAFLVSADPQALARRIDKSDMALVFAADAADARAMAKSKFNADSNTQWDEAIVTQLAADTDYENWRMRVQVAPAAGGPNIADVTFTGLAAATLDDLALGCVALLNLTPSISVSSHGNRLAFGDFDDEGEDYTVGDILTPVEGTGDPLATFRVDSVNGSGEIQTASVVNRGAYSVSPGDGDMAGGTGNGAEFEFIITDNVLAAADVADNLGDHSLLVELLPPAAEHDGAIAVPSAVLVVTDEGVAAAALDAQLAPDSFILPNLLATGKRS